MHKCDKKIKTRTIHICLTDINCSGLRSFSSTFITVYRAHCSLVGTVQRIIFIIYIYQEGFVSISHRYGSTLIIKEAYMYAEKKFQSLIGTVQLFYLEKILIFLQVSISHRYGSTREQLTQQFYQNTKVSISHRYGSTTVFTAFHVFIIPYFYRFSIFFSKKVGQPLHNKFPQSLDSTGFFIFVKISSEVHRLFGRFLLFSALFHAVFVLEALILLAWRFTDFFLQIF